MNIVQLLRPPPRRACIRLLQVALLLGIALAMVLLSGCTTPKAQAPATTQPVALPTEPPALPPTEPPAPTLPPPEPTAVPEIAAVAPPAEPGVKLDSPEYKLIAAAWSESPMAKTYDLGKGPNTYCSRCHSPQNWDPASMPDKAPNCITCKFPQDPEVRQATTMKFVEEADWKGIPCETCHATDGETVLAALSWLNPLTMEHEAVATSNDLCGKCHANTQGVKASGGRGVTHGITLGGSAHLNWAGALPQDHRPDQCSDCHTAHQMAPKQCSDCHADVLTNAEHMKGTVADHANVTCMACHDASGAQLAPFPADAEDAQWTTVVTSTSRSGETTTAYAHSHSIKWQVDCSRCHFKDNPFELSVLTADGTVPTPPAP